MARTAITSKISGFNFYQQLATNHPIYTDCKARGYSRKPVGIVVHSTGCNNNTLKRYVQPDDGFIGVNANNNAMNLASNRQYGVHGFVGKNKLGVTEFYQTLPWCDYCWGAGSGSRGSYNYTHIQFEICEDDLTNGTYFWDAMTVAAKMCAHLCLSYGLSVGTIVSHKEACALGYATNHGDCDNWLTKFGYTMDTFRAWVQYWIAHATGGGTTVQAATSAAAETAPGAGVYKVTTKTLYIRTGPGTSYPDKGYIKPGVYTITQVDGTWGKLKSGAGWICLDYATKV